MRKTILHMDMDAFYASVEVMDDPSLKGKPLIIGALPTERGVVSTASYEARKYGVHSGMSIKEAYKLCPEGIYMHGHFQRYHEISHMVHEILESYTDQVEYIALDEGYLDITGSLKLFGGAEKIGQEIRKRVFDTTGLTCSVGIGYNKMTAKLGSEEKKPNGFFVIPDPEFFREYYAKRPIRIIPGIGPKMEDYLHRQKLDTIGDVQKMDEKMLVGMIGENGHDLYMACQGYGSDTVMTKDMYEAKSYGKEVTYQADMTEMEEMKSTLKLLARDVSIGLMRRGVYASCVTLKIKYNDLKLHTRSFTGADSWQSAEELYRIAESMLVNTKLERPVRLLGISTSSFSTEPIHQLSLEESEQKSMQSEKKKKLDRSLMGLYDRFGKDIVRTGGEIASEEVMNAEKFHGGKIS